MCWARRSKRVMITTSLGDPGGARFVFLPKLPNWVGLGRRAYGIWSASKKASMEKNNDSWILRPLGPGPQVDSHPFSCLPRSDVRADLNWSSPSRRQHLDRERADKMQRRASNKGNSSWVSYLNLGNVGAGSAVRQLCAVLALAAAVVAADLASAQPFDPVARDIRTGAYRGHAVTYEVIDGLAIWDGDIILGTPEDLVPESALASGHTLDSRNKISATSRKERLWPGGRGQATPSPEAWPWTRPATSSSRQAFT